MPQDLSAVAAQALDCISDLLGVQSAALFLLDDGAYAPVGVKGLEIPDGLTLPVGCPLAGMLGASAAPKFLSEDDPDLLALKGADEAARTLLDSFPFRLLVPVLSHGDFVGLFALGEKNPPGEYSEEDCRLLEHIASFVRVGFEREKEQRRLKSLHDEDQRRSRWLFQELETAREMYEGLLPEHFKELPELDCAGRCLQVFAIGGDYYDFIPVKEGNFVFVVGDVSGKGITAALMMAYLRATLRREMSQQTMNVAGLVSHLNQLVFDASPSSRYITLFYAQYDRRAARIQFVNAGHQPPLFFRRQAGRHSTQILEEGGAPVGMFAKTFYSQGTRIIQPGDVIVAFTDGVIEAKNSEDEEWGIERLKEVVLQNHEALDAGGLADLVFKEVKEFVAGAQQYDDMTIVVVKALAANGK
jgi:sigma-B regulation protein RsbU (phosphoserine phosphatase)